MDDYIQYDADTAIKHVLNYTGKDKVNWIGHSMGGAIIYSRIGSLGEKRIVNFVAIGSSAILDSPSSALKSWGSLTRLMSLLPVVPAETWIGIEGATGISFLSREFSTNFLARTQYRFFDSFGNKNDFDQSGNEERSPSISGSCGKRRTSKFGS